MSDVESDTGPWAAVPAWVLDSKISPRAFKLYCVLSLYADGGASGNGGTTRSRAGMAARLGCSVDTLDRAANELEAIGAIERIARFDALGDRAPNRWRLYRSRPGQRISAATGERELAAVEIPRPPKDPDPQKPLVRDSGFDLFYSAYPRKVAPTAARKAWDKAVKKTDPSRIIAAAHRYRDDPNLPEPQFIPHPSKWLNDGRWEDGPQPPRKRQPGEAPSIPAADQPANTRTFANYEEFKAWQATQK